MNAGPGSGAQGSVLQVEPFAGPLDASVRPPGSKSITNRALLIAALAEGESVLDGVLFADDTEAMIACIRSLGAGVIGDRESRRLTILGTGGRIASGPVTLDADLSGTTARFIGAALALGQGTYRLDGGESLRRRPMSETFAGLQQLGATVTFLGRDDSLPADIHLDGTDRSGRAAGGVQAGRVVTVAGDRSSQFLSGLLLMGPCLAGGLRLELTSPLVSRPYVDMTISIMRAFGAEVEEDSDGMTVAGAPYRAGRFAVEPDASAASYFFAMAAICGGRVTVEGLGRSSLQGDVAFVDVLERMGATIERTEDRITVTGPALRGVDADFSLISDTAQTIAAVAAFTEGETRVRGIGFIRGKETDRIAAVVSELIRLGVDATEEPDGFVIRPGRIHGGDVRTYDDHRMAMSFALLGLRVPGIRILDPGCVAKTFPDYFAEVERIRPEKVR